MLKGFEDITVDLDESDIALAHYIAKGFKARIGKENAISNKQIRKIFKERNLVSIGDVKMRKIVQYIRVNNLAPRLCSNSAGYFTAQNQQEWENWKESMKQRIRQQIFTLRCAEKFNS